MKSFPTISVTAVQLFEIHRSQLCVLRADMLVSRLLSQDQRYLVVKPHPFLARGGLMVGYGCAEQVCISFARFEECYSAVEDRVASDCCRQGLSNLFHRFLCGSVPGRMPGLGDQESSDDSLVKLLIVFQERSFSSQRSCVTEGTSGEPSAVRRSVLTVSRTLSEPLGRLVLKG
jgi:hypothetical protein